MKVKCSNCGTTKVIDYYVEINDDDYCYATDGATTIKADKHYEYQEENHSSKTFSDTDISGVVYIEARNLDDYNCLFNKCINITDVLFTKKL